MEIVSAPDVKGSVFYVVKEICKRIQAGERTADIAILARDVAPYQEELRRACRANCLPLNASFVYPFHKYALGTFCLNLLELGASGFAREKVLAVFSSPYFKEVHKAAWRRLVSRSLVNRDISQWNDLLPQAPGFEQDVLTWIDTANAALEKLSRPQLWEDGVKLAIDFLTTHVDESAFEGKDAEIYQKIKETILKINSYSAVRKQCEPGELVQEITQALASLAFNEVEAVQGGITVTDAMRARGLSFKTVFLLGLNDQEFPLVMPEDPILRDYYRYHLRDTLGYWINASLDRGDEEKLLFYNAVTCATDHLYILYHRYDNEGKPVVPSVYVAELARACELNLQAADAPRVSGRVLERLRTCDTFCLTPKEFSYRLILSGEPLQKYRMAGLLTNEKERAFVAANQRDIPDKLSANHECTTETIGQYGHVKILLPDAKQESCGARCDKENLEDEADFLFAEHIRQKADRRHEHGEEQPREEEANEFTCFFPSVAEQPSAEIGEDEIQRQKGCAYDEGGLGEELPEDMFDALVLLYAFGRALVEHLVDRVADDVERPECQGYRHPEQANAGQAESGRE